MFAQGTLLLLLADIALGVQVYLNPQPAALTTPSALSPAQARAVVSHHLRLEVFDDIQDVHGVEQLVSGDFVGQGTGSALLLTLSEDVARDVIPPSFKRSFSLSNPSSVFSELSLVVSSYLQRAERVYTTVVSETPHAVVPQLIDVFGAHPSSATDAFLSETAQLVALVEDEQSDVFGAFAMEGLAKLGAEYGRESELYKLATETTRALLESALSKSSLSLALLTYPATATHAHVARQQPPEQSPFPVPTASPQLPIGGVSTCFTSADACGNATSSCSGHGSCVEAHKAGKSCFVCACAPTRDDLGRPQEWAGDACQRKDVSATFVLITGTVIGLVIVIFGSISLLYSVGAQSLPSTLVAGASGHVKRD